jgi:hypothetical protein
MGGSPLRVGPQAAESVLDNSKVVLVAKTIGASFTMAPDLATKSAAGRGKATRRAADGFAPANFDGGFGLSIPGIWQSMKVTYRKITDCWLPCASPHPGATPGRLSAGRGDNLADNQSPRRALPPHPRHSRLLRPLWQNRTL